MNPGGKGFELNLNTARKTERHLLFLPLIFLRATACNEQLHCWWCAVPCIWNSDNYAILEGLQEDHLSFSLLKENTSPLLYNVLSKLSLCWNFSIQVSYDYCTNKHCSSLWHAESWFSNKPVPGLNGYTQAFWTHLTHRQSRRKLTSRQEKKDYKSNWLHSCH